jgi:hypothetical protein
LQLRRRYVAALKSLNISGDTGRGDRINDILYITNNRSVIRDLIPLDSVPLIGSLEWDFVRKAGVVIWADVSFDEKKDPLGVLNELLYDTQSFLQSIWLFKDNSVDAEIGFLFFRPGGNPTASSNYIDLGIK